MSTGARPRRRAARDSAARLLVACALAVLSSAAPAAAKAWRGVVPLASTRADVERLLGRPTREGGGLHFYDLRGEAAFVWFGDGKCDPWGVKWDVPGGTVTHVAVIPKRRVKVSALLDPSAAETENTTRDYAVHRDDRAGILVESQNGHVVVATYEPGRADWPRRCPVQEKPSHGFPHQFPFDVYGRIPREDESARLDNYANALIELPTMRGVIVAYGGRRGVRGEARERAARAKSYLVGKRGIEPWRITTIDGGYREESVVELNVLPIGGIFTPVVAPTVAPEEVEFVCREAARRRPGRKVGRREN